MLQTVLQTLSAHFHPQIAFIVLFLFFIFYLFFMWQALSAHFHPQVAFAEARASNKVCPCVMFFNARNCFLFLLAFAEARASNIWTYVFLFSFFYFM